MDGSWGHSISHALLNQEAKAPPTIFSASNTETPIEANCQLPRLEKAYPFAEVPPNTRDGRVPPCSGGSPAGIIAVGVLWGPPVKAKRKSNHLGNPPFFWTSSSICLPQCALSPQICPGTSLVTCFYVCNQTETNRFGPSPMLGGCKWPDTDTYCAWTTSLAHPQETRNDLSPQSTYQHAMVSTMISKWREGLA